MAASDRPRHDSADDEEGAGVHTEDRTQEEALRARLTQDPNDTAAFDELARIVRSRAVEGHDVGDPQREADDAVWALAEEVARSGRAWYPLIELARLSIDDDREVALRRVGTAAERDPSGHALAQGLQMLREAGHSADALNLGLGHWRPREHVVDAGRQLVEAAVESHRLGEARRHLDAMAAHPDTQAVEKLRRELEHRIERAEAERGQAGRPAPKDETDPDPDPEPAGRATPTVDIRESTVRIADGPAENTPEGDEKDSGLLGFLKR